MLDTLTPSEMEAMAAEPYETRGIIHSEMALIVHICRRLGVDMVIESGRARAQSTVMLSKYLPWADIHSIEMRADVDAEYGRRRCAGLANVTLYTGDGALEAIRLASCNQGKRIAILLDGPKGARAVEVLVQAFRLPQVLCGFIHDMRRLDHGGPSPHRAAAIARLERHAFSDDPRIVHASAWMDAKVLEAGPFCGPEFERVHGSYGPTVGVFINPASTKH